MDTFQIQIGIYEIFSIVIPGFLVICSIWIAATGWAAFATELKGLSWSVLALLMLASFGAGHLTQEVADKTIKWYASERFFKGGRDKFWNEAKSQVVKEALAQEVGQSIADVDLAFDYCMARVGNRFALRELFIAYSDLARGLLVVAIVGIAPVVRLARDNAKSKRRRLWTLSAAGVLFLGLVSYLAWERMVRFRALAENIFPGCVAVLTETRAMAPQK